MTSYYSDPITFIHAQIASQTSILVDYNYALNIVNTQIENSQPEIPLDLLEQQVTLQSSIDSQQIYISTLQSALPSSNVDLSGSEVVPPLIPQAIPPLVDLSNNIVS